ncbi:MAG: class I SAM-dependent methyltransferase [Candidatus Omnitrophica bacterium]|nr:class I SAM-dependent methyltransferase [Candidatus Omnitrophota bacterium]MBU1925436.1 class I SAM-dependent methyltransferase [Candidatus Omnitrophota bacterium]MBU2062870.1 class I SAM-dependent methyltransferase [Candidatus Omnitrophota bacterium]
MLGPRYKYDAKPIIKLNGLQMSMKKQIESKIQQGHYKTERVNCIICGEGDFEQLSEKDRFGLVASVVICRECGLIQTNPRLSQESYNEFYNDEFTKLIFGRERTTQDLFFDQYFHGQKICKYLKGSLPKELKDLFILEVGCAAGGILAYFRDLGCSVSGMDLGQEAVDFGRKKYNLDLQVGALADCKLNRKPDIIIMSHILEHLLNPIQELERARALLDEKGFMYIEVPGIRNLGRAQYDLNFLHFLQIPHTDHFSLTTLTNLLNKTGFECVRGNEMVRSIFRITKDRVLCRNNYKAALSYLRRMELLRKYLPITPFKIRYIFEVASCWLLKRTGVYKFTRGIYRKMIKRTEPKK